jgi:RNA polymerase sigma-70 factor (ECF subfamily)
MRGGRSGNWVPEEIGHDVRQARGGDEAAFERLYAELAPRVRVAAYRLIRDRHEAEDTTQDAFLAAHRCLERLTDPIAFEAWLMKIVRNRAMDRRRGMLKCRPSERAHDDSSDRSPDLQKVLFRTGVSEPTAESVASLRDTLSVMPPGLRDVLRLRYLQGLSCHSIARREGVSLMAVKTRLFRARRRLREALTPGDRLDAPQAPREGKKTCVSTSRS